MKNGAMTFTGKWVDIEITRVNEPLKDKYHIQQIIEIYTQRGCMGIGDFFEGRKKHNGEQEKN